MTRKEQYSLARNINSLSAVVGAISAIVDSLDPEKVKRKGTWAYWFTRFFEWLKDPESKTPVFNIFGLKGNKKLKFATFSSLAVFDCPGKGACENFCYSLKGWRYPCAYLRQLQNSILLRFFPWMVESAFLELPKNITLRLYVDGDFYSLENLNWWMELIRKREDIKVYGYSKSWMEFVKLDNNGKYAWPKNYLVNASSGSKHEKTGIARAFKALKVVRGEFIATKVSKKWMESGAYQGKDKPGNLEYRKEIREKLKALSKKVFACPGTCYNCLASEHACGSEKMKGITIAIGIH